MSALVFCCTRKQELDQSVGKVIKILSLKVGIVKEPCDIMSTEVTYETDHISVLCHSTMSSVLNFCFLLFYCDLKEKYHVRRNINFKQNKSLYVK